MTERIDYLISYIWRAFIINVFLPLRDIMVG